MNKANSTHRWFTGWRSAERPAPSDPADMGTAFGLDMSLLELEYDLPPDLPPARPAGWVQRLTTRRKPAF